MPTTCRARRLILAALAGLSGALPAAAAAEGAEAAEAAVAAGAAAAEPAVSQQLDAIVVTAQKRKDRLEEVPISISVLNGRQLEQRQIRSYEDLSRALPDLAFTGGGGSGMRNIEIRGVSSEAGAATVGTYLDDVSMTVANTLDIGASEPRFFDIEQVELLRGPQGTLYGASSLGGTLRFTSRQPDARGREFSGAASVEFTERGAMSHSEQAVANLPIRDGVSALRVGLQYTTTGGTIDQRSPALAADGVTPLPQTITARDINGERALALKAAYKHEADGLSLLPALLYQRVQTANTDLFDLGTPLQTARLVPESGADTLFVPSLTARLTLPWADVTSISSYFWRHFRSIRDGTSYNSAYLAEILAADQVLAAQYPGADPAPVGVRPGTALYRPQVIQGAQEFRIASKSMRESGLPYAWLAGLYLAQEQGHASVDETVDRGIETLTGVYGVDGAQILAENLTNPVDQGGAGLTPEQAALAVSTGNSVYTQDSRQRVRQASVFGEANWQPLERLTLTGGLRYLLAGIRADNRTGGYYNADAPPRVVSRARFYAFTPKASALYLLAPGNSVYATVVKGFRLGGANLQLPAYGCKDNQASLGVGDPPATYSPDSLWSYETGFKTSFLGNRIGIDGSVYYLDWRHVQQKILLNTCGFDFTQNAGNARSYGGDLSLRAKLGREWTATLNGNRTQATITRAENGTGAQNGSRLLGVPAWSLTPALAWNGALLDDLRGQALIDWSLVGPQPRQLRPR